MSGTTMRASLLLTLEDQLTGGLDRMLASMSRLNEVIDKIADAMKKLELGTLFVKDQKDIGDTVTKLDGLETKLKTVGTTAQTMGSHLHEMWEKFTGSATGQGLRAVGQKFNEFAQSVGPIGGLAAGFGTLDVASQSANFENILTHISISKGLSGDKVGQENARLKKMFYADAQETGQSSESIANAYSKMLTAGIAADVLDRVIGQHSKIATAYNIAPDELDGLAKAGLRNFRILEEQFGVFMAAGALAAKEGDFKIGDFSHEMPAVSAAFANMGMTGRDGANTAFAALETIMKGTGLPSSAAADLIDHLNYLTGQMAAKEFKQVGVDLPAELLKGEHAGKTPLDTVLELLNRVTTDVKGDPIAVAEKLRGLFHNNQALQAILPLLEHQEDFYRLKAKLNAVDPALVDRDFQTGRASPLMAINLFHENWDELMRTLGEGAMGPLKTVTGLLKATNEAFAWMDEHLPGVTNKVTGIGMSLLAVTGAIGVLGFVLPMFTKGLELLGAVGDLFHIGAGLKAIADGIGLLKLSEAGAVAGDITKLSVGLTGLAGPLGVLIAGLGVGVWGGYLLGQYDDKARAGLTPAELKAADDAAAGITYEWGLPTGPRQMIAPAQAPAGQVNINITADPGLNVAAKGQGVGKITTAPNDDSIRMLGRE